MYNWYRNYLNRKATNVNTRDVLHAQDKVAARRKAKNSRSLTDDLVILLHSTPQKSPRNVQ